MNFGSYARLMAVLFAVGACTSSDGETLPPISSVETSVTTTTTELVETSPPAPVSDEDDLRELWSDLWVASGLVPEERQAAVTKIADSLDPAVAAMIPELLPVPEEREVLTDPAFTKNVDGSIDIRDCVLYTPPYRGIFAPHVHEGHATPDGEGGWLIEEAAQVGQGCVPAAMADKILADYDEYIQVLADSGNPPDPDHPGLAKTMTGGYLERLIVGNQQLLDENWYYEDFDMNHPEIVEIPGSNVVRIRDCVELDPRSGIFESDGTLIGDYEPAKPGERTLFDTTMRLEGGQWKTESVEVESQSTCEIAPTVVGLPEI